MTHLRRAERAHAEENGEAIWTAMSAAASLYQAPFLAGEFDPPQILSAREKFHQSYIRQILASGAWLSAHQLDEKAIDLYRRALETDVQAETLYQGMMRCYLHRGRLTEGLAIYERCRTALRANGGPAPSHETEKLREELVAAQRNQPLRQDVLSKSVPSVPPSEQSRATTPEREEPASSVGPLTLRGTAIPVTENSRHVVTLTRVIPIGGATILVAVLLLFLLRTQDGPEILGRPSNQATIPEQPTLAVLPFVNLSGDPEQDHFSDGITEEIITELTRFRTLRVAPRSSTFQYKGRAVDAREVGRTLGTRYVVEGSVRIARERIRISAQLMDASDGKNLWAETYDRKFNPNQIFEIQDDIKLRIVATIADTYGVISETGMEQSKRRASESLVAYECVLRAHALYRNNYVPPEHFRVRECLERAVQLDPGYADAWAWLAGMYRDEFYHEWNLRPSPVDRAEQAARRAIDLEPTNQEAHLVLSHVLLYKRDPGAFDQAERAIALNPNSPDLIGGVAFAYGPAGKWDRGVELAQKAIALTRDPPGWMYIPVHFDHYRKGKFDEALEVALKMKITMGNWYWTYVCLAIDNMELGREAEAKAAVARLLEIEPNFAAKARSRIAFVIWSDDLTDRIIHVLQKAGL
jgi:TolB-like protein/Tfp pilus assembly protein PilF